jgi:pimeloyl-ACP methyl ester carboxylesterase
MVLLDVCHEDQNWRMAPLFTDAVRRIYFGQFTVEGTLQEFEDSLDQVRGLTLGHLPLIVITGGSQPSHTKESMKIWMEFQQQISQLSTDSTHYILNKASHAVHIEEPEAVIRAIAIKEMVEKVVR